MSETIKRGRGEIKLSWKKDNIKREAAICSDFTEGELLNVFAHLIAGNPPDGWMNGYAAGRQEGVNATRLEYAMKQKGGKK